MKTYTSRDIADGIISGKINRDTKFVLESSASAKIEDIMSTLELLHSVQNGCPLPKYENDWNLAMEQVATLLENNNE
jgi:hypothetical protein